MSISPSNASSTSAPGLPKPLAIAGQVFFYGAFIAFIGYFSSNPRYEHLAPDKALLKISLAHFGDRECRKRSPEELAKLPRNMRNPMDCPRGRSPIRLEVDLNGVPLVQHTLKPTGLSGDGISTMYRRVELPAGEHKLAVRMNDNEREPGFKYVKEEVVNLKPGQVLVVDYNPDHGGLFFR
ncbi:MAG: hypothetical protein IPH08_06080 [Rhodocyclaceae bacterium]|jgi:hypothetical protein|nr:hypothetical protein [Rhodocyclaceae bacterium]